MTNISFYFKLHKPFLLKEYKVFDVGYNHDYFNEERNKSMIIQAGKKYKKTNELLLKLINENNKNIKIAFSISGTTLELMNKYAKDVLISFQKLAETGCIEFLGETYYHSLSFLFSEEEHIEQIKLHTKAIEKYFNLTPRTYRVNRLKYSNELAQKSYELGFKNILIENNKSILNFRSPNSIYSSTNNMKLLTKNNKITNEIKLNIKNEKMNFDILNIINKSTQEDIINLSFKYNLLNTEFSQEYLEKFIRKYLENQQNNFLLPVEASNKLESKEILDVAQSEEKITSSTKELWLGNKMQQTISNQIYVMESKVKDSNNEELLDSWRKFTTSNNFYFLTTKSIENKLHSLNIKNIYGSPYEAYSYFINAISDLVINVEEKLGLIQTKAQEVTNDNN